MIRHARLGPHRAYRLWLTAYIKLHFGQVDNCLLDPFHLRSYFDLVNILPWFPEIPDGLRIGCSGRSFCDHLINRIEDTAELLPVTV